MSKMTIIQLLNKIANGEDVPKKIKYPMGDCEEFYLVDLYERLFDEDIILNDEVEIIEEDKKMEKLYIRDRANDILIGKNEKITYATDSLVSKELALKINEIIDKINKGEE